MITVTAAIIIENNQILICQRGPGGSCAELWEFPGGKQEPGEALEDCIIRECKEEMGVEIAVKGIFAETNYSYPERDIEFTFFEADIVSGTLTNYVHKEILWVEIDNLNEYPFCPADEEIVKRIIERQAEGK